MKSFDDLLNALVAVKEELGEKPAQVALVPAEGEDLEVEITTSFKAGKAERTVVIHA